MHYRFKFRQISDQLEAADPNTTSTMPSELVNLIASLALRWARTADMGGKTDKELFAEIDLYLGYGIVAAQAIKLVVALARLCREVQDGNKQKAVVDYLNRRLHIAMIHYPVIGRELPKVLAQKVADDLDRVRSSAALQLASASVATK